MKSARKKRSSVVSEPTTDTPALTTFSSDLLTPEEERELLAAFWDCKSELVRVLLRHFPRLRRQPAAARAVADGPVHPRALHRGRAATSPPSAASTTATSTSSTGSPRANIRLAAHVAKRFRHHALSYADLLQEAVCGLMQAIDRFDVSHGTRLATYATWWIRQTLQIAVARQSHLVSLSPHHLQELGLLQQESEALAHGGKHLPEPAGTGLAAPAAASST